MAVKEFCVRCGKETEYLISTPVESRRYFIEGSGQLCEECINKLWSTKSGLLFTCTPTFNLRKINCFNA